MQKSRLAAALALATALAACRDGGSRTPLTAPSATPPRDAHASATALVPVMGGDLIARATSATARATVTATTSDATTLEELPTKGRAFGEYALTLPGGFSMRTSFDAGTTRELPRADGKVVWRGTVGTTTFVARVRVACVVVVGNTAWASGTIREFLVNGLPAEPAAPYAQIQVSDGDTPEAAGTDMGSPLFYAGTPLDCQLRTPMPLFASTRGDIEVQRW